jgi:DNA-binding transcriptional LysR family regulator
MRELNLAAIDLNLLPALEALLRRRNVTHAAADVGLSQPAMSRALGRLRDLLGDPLLVRAAGGFALTPRARELEPHLAVALGNVHTVLRAPTFDPRTAKRTIRIACTDSQTILLAPGIMARLAHEAPGIDIRMESYGENVVARMESGELDLAFALTSTPLPPGAQSEPIASDRLCIALRRGHPAARRKWTMADYAKVDHVGISIFGDGVSEMDALLAAAGVTRRMALVTPHFYAALEAVAVTDLATTISRALANRFAKSLDLVLLDPPFREVDMQIALVWSPVRASDPLLAWLRTVITAVAREVHAATN